MHTLLDPIEAVIAYEPLPEEPDPTAVTPLPAAYRIAPRADLDPEKEVSAAMQAAGSRTVAVLLPGTRFDATGTRHGRGGGWYDRFLAAAPLEWLRVGICSPDQLSPEPLERQPWDQPVDLLCVAEDGDARWIETRARS